MSKSRLEDGDCLDVLKTIEDSSINSVLTDPQITLAKAYIRASDSLGLSKDFAAKSIGVSASTLTRMSKEGGRLDPSSKTGEIALMVIRVFRSLTAVVGSNKELRQAWMRERVASLGGCPRDLILSIEGIVRVLSYLDGMRKDH